MIHFEDLTEENVIKAIAEYLDYCEKTLAGYSLELDPNRTIFSNTVTKSTIAIFYEKHYYNVIEKTLPIKFIDSGYNAHIMNISRVFLLSGESLLKAYKDYKYQLAKIGDIGMFKTPRGEIGFLLNLASERIDCLLYTNHNPR
jgi:hypothetical protein